MVDHIPPLVHLAALDQRRLARMPPHRRRQRLAAIQYVQTRHAEVQPARRQIAATGRPGEFSGHDVVKARAAGAAYREPKMSPREARAEGGNRSEPARNEPARNEANRNGARNDRPAARAENNGARGNQGRSEAGANETRNNQARNNAARSNQERKNEVRNQSRTERADRAPKAAHENDRPAKQERQAQKQARPEKPAKPAKPEPKREGHR